MAEDQVLPGAHANFALGDLIRYISVVTQVVTLFAQAKTLVVGATMAVPPIKAKIDGKSYVWEKDSLTRTA